MINITGYDAKGFWKALNVVKTRRMRALARINDEFNVSLGVLKGISKIIKNERTIVDVMVLPDNKLRLRYYIGDIQITSILCDPADCNEEYFINYKLSGRKSYYDEHPSVYLEV
jgi:hypothetical protein